MIVNTDEITKVIKNQIESYSSDLNFSEAGTVIQVGDGIARVYGYMGNERGTSGISNGTYGMALNLDEDSIGVVIWAQIRHQGRGPG